MRKSVAGALGLLFLCACPQQPSGRGWTVLVYMLADNDLEPFAVADLQEMSGVGSSSEMRFAVQFDRNPAYADTPLEGAGDWSGAKRLEVQSERFKSVGDLGQVNMADPAVLSEFIRWGFETYPAEKVALVLWDHGGAWPAFGRDESAGKGGFDLPKLKEAIAAGLPQGKKLALLGFDACLMGSFEVARAMAPVADYLIASEELEPGTGWDYRSFKVLLDEPTTSPDALGKQILDGFAAASSADSQAAYITLAVTDLNAMGSLDQALQALAAAAQGASSEGGVGRIRSNALKFGEFTRPEDSVYMVDLGDFSQRLAGSDPRFQAPHQQISTALSQAVVHKVSGQVTQASTGLSLYFPPNLNTYNAGYDALAEVSGWRGFLKSYFVATGSAGPTFSSPTHLAQANFLGDTPSGPVRGVEISGALIPGSAGRITSAYFVYGVQDTGGNTLLFGRGPAAVDVASDSVAGSWNLTAAFLAQGNTSGYGYLDQRGTDDAAASASIPFTYREDGSPQSPASSVVRRLSWDAQGNIVNDGYFREKDGQYGELTPKQGATLSPLIQKMDAQGNVTWALGSTTAFSGADLKASPIQLSSDRIRSGVTAFGALLIEDATGRTDFAYVAAPVP